MKTPMTLLLLLITLLSCGSPSDKQPASGNDQTQLISPEQMILNATFETYDGKVLRISDLKGKVVLVDFWESWCRPCLMIMPTLSEVQTDYPEDIVIIAATLQAQDTEADTRKFIKDTGYNLVYVKGGDLARALNVTGIPFKALIQRDGKTVKFARGTRGPADEKKTLVEAINLQKTKG